MNVGRAPAQSTVQVRVRLFAMLRERARASTLELALGPGATVADAMRALAEHEPLAELLGRLPVRLAVNREYADGDTELSAGDEIALIPPLSGGSRLVERVHVRISAEPLSAEGVRTAGADPRAGAIVGF